MGRENKVPRAILCMLETCTSWFEKFVAQQGMHIKEIFQATRFYE